MLASFGFCLFDFSPQRSTDQVKIHCFRIWIETQFKMFLLITSLSTQVQECKVHLNLLCLHSMTSLDK